MEGEGVEKGLGQSRASRSSHLKRLVQTIIFHQVQLRYKLPHHMTQYSLTISMSSLADDVGFS